MSIKVNKYNQETKQLQEKEVIEKVDMPSYIYEAKKVDYAYDCYEEFNKITNPVEGLKKIWNRLPINENGQFIFNVWLGCGAQYLAIVQKANDKYGSAIIFGYSASTIIYAKLVNGVWG